MKRKINVKKGNLIGPILFGILSLILIISAYTHSKINTLELLLTIIIDILLFVIIIFYFYNYAVLTDDAICIKNYLIRGNKREFKWSEIKKVSIYNRWNRNITIKINEKLFTCNGMTMKELIRIADHLNEKNIHVDFPHRS